MSYGPPKSFDEIVLGTILVYPQLIGRKHD
jgi:hypothetical protein